MENPHPSQNSVPITNGGTTINGSSKDLEASQQSRATELASLLQAVLTQLIPFVQSADDELKAHQNNLAVAKSSLVDYQTPTDLTNILQQQQQQQQADGSTSSILNLANSQQQQTLGQSGLLNTLTTILRYSVNPSSPGFLDKLYSAPLAPGVAADLILSVLNTNLHVYSVSPVLTLIEKHVTKQLARLFGFDGPRAGGISCQGGSASNLTSIVVARNTLFPETKEWGNAGFEGRLLASGKLVMFTSAHGHYSVEKAAVALGFGRDSVVSVPVDGEGRMRVDELERLILESKAKGQRPFYVNVTAGTTVLGSFDPIREIVDVARRHWLWVHVDAAWGGGFVFSDELKRSRLDGIEDANTVAFNPHKMLGVPVTCSFLLGGDLKAFHKANTLRAGYLFHDDDNDDEYGDGKIKGPDYREDEEEDEEDEEDEDEEDWVEPNDLADLTLQCGRRGDSLKLFLAWQYYGTNGYREKIEGAYSVAKYMVELIEKNPDLLLVSQNPPPCLQVCFYYAPQKKMAFGEEKEQQRLDVPTKAKNRKKLLGRYNSRVTERITRNLVSRGFMIDFAPALEGQEEAGKFFRVVINIQTCKETVERLVGEIVEIGKQVVLEMGSPPTKV